MAIYSKIHLQNTHIDIWKIEEAESFFIQKLGFSAEIKNDVKRLEHLAGRFLLQYQNSHINFEHLTITSSKKPILACGSFEFSLSHSFPFVACASRVDDSVGIDIQMIREKIFLIRHKFLHENELKKYGEDLSLLTLFWSTKEAVYKYLGSGGQEFKSDFYIKNIQQVALRMYAIKVLIFPDTLNEKEIEVMGIINDEYTLACTC